MSNTRSPGSHHNPSLSGGRTVALATLVAALSVAAVLAAAPNGAAGAAGATVGLPDDAPRHEASSQWQEPALMQQAPSSPRQATPGPTPTLEYVEPSGPWSAVHAPRHDPLWTNAAPTLRGVHGTWDGDKWVGWAVGDSGGMARFDGTRWRVVDDFEPMRTQPLTYSFRDVFVAAPDDVWVVGMSEGDRYCDGCGMILHYDGQAWTELDRYSYGVNGRIAAFNAIDMLQDEHGDWYGWIVGDDADFDRFKAAMIRYTPEEEWDVWPTHNIAKNLNDVRLVSPVEAWAVGQDGVESRYNEDSGTGLWPPLGRSGADTLYAVDLADQLDGWDGGFRGRMNKYRGHCHDDDPATQCWFQNEALPIRGLNGGQWAITVRGIDVLARNEAWLVGEQSGRVSTVAYLSAPKKWQLVPVVDDPGEHLYGLHMVSRSWGLAVGDDGTIIEYRGTVIPTVVPTDTASVTPTATGTPTATDPANATETAAAGATGTAESRATLTSGAGATQTAAASATTNAASRTPGTPGTPGTPSTSGTPGTPDGTSTAVATPTPSATGSTPTPPTSIYLPLASRSY